MLGVGRAFCFAGYRTPRFSGCGFSLVAQAFLPVLFDRSNGTQQAADGTFIFSLAAFP
jgi:hypothetical protein